MHDIDLLSATETTTASDGGVGNLSRCKAATAPCVAKNVSRVLTMTLGATAARHGAGDVRWRRQARAKMRTGWAV